MIKTFSIANRIYMKLVFYIYIVGKIIAKYLGSVDHLFRVFSRYLIILGYHKMNLFSLLIIYS